MLVSRAVWTSFMWLQSKRQGVYTWHHFVRLRLQTQPENQYTHIPTIPITNSVDHRALIVSFVDTVRDVSKTHAQRHSFRAMHGTLQLAAIAGPWCSLLWQTVTHSRQLVYVHLLIGWKGYVCTGSKSTCQTWYDHKCKPRSCASM